MTVAHGGSIVIPYVCALYTCECGRRRIRHGSRAGSPPADWETRTGGVHVCDVCCGKTAARPKPAR